MNMSSGGGQLEPRATMQASRAPRISEAEWNTRRQKLETLYLRDNVSRQEIIEIMAREDSFLVTEKQLKYQFNKWGLKKYISDQDLTMMLSFKRKRQALGKDTGFMYRGHLFEQERLERASKRRKGRLISSPVLPPYIGVLMSPRQSPEMSFFPPAHGRTSAVPDRTEEVIHNIGRPISLDSPVNNSGQQLESLSSSDAWNSLHASSGLPVVDDGQQTQANSGLLETLLDNNSVSFSPRRESHIPTPSRQNIEVTRTETPSRFTQQTTGITSDFSAMLSANENDSTFANINMDLDFSDSLNSPLGPIRARNSLSHEETQPRKSNERSGISPLQLADQNETYECTPQVAKCLRALIERGARLDVRDEVGRGPLHSALSPHPGLSDWVDPICTWREEDESGNNNYWLNEIGGTEDQMHVEDYYDRESMLDPLTAPTSAHTSRSTPSLDGVESSQLGCDEGSNVPAEQPLPIDLSSSDLDSDISSCAGESISESDNDDYVHAVDQDGRHERIRNPVHVLKNRVRTKLMILLEAGCDPNGLDDDGNSPNDYAKRGLWPQWLWALEKAGYVFDEGQDRWIKQVVLLD